MGSDQPEAENRSDGQEPGSADIPLRYVAAPGHSDNASPPSCGTCQHRDGACSKVCLEMEKQLPGDRTGRSNREHNNDFDIESRVKRCPVAPKRDFSKLLEVPHIFTAKQLFVLHWMNEGLSRNAVSRLLGVSPPRVSQLLTASLARYDRREARLRAEMLRELRKLEEGDDG